MKKNIKNKVFVKIGNEFNKLSTIFFILGILLIDLNGLRTFKALNPLIEGKFEIFVQVNAKSNKLTKLIVKSEIFQNSLK